jgi:hypothetical protein
VLSLPGKDGWVVDIKSIRNLERCTETDKQFTELWKHRARKNFPNFRSQMYWKLKDDLEHNRIDLSFLLIDKDTDDLAIEELQKELLAITYEERAGMIYILSKKEMRHPDRLGHSPDFADTLAMWNWVRERTRARPEVTYPWDEPKRREDDYSTEESRMLA